MAVGVHTESVESSYRCVGYALRRCKGKVTEMDGYEEGGGAGISLTFTAAAAWPAGLRSEARLADVEGAGGGGD